MYMCTCTQACKKQDESRLWPDGRCPSQEEQWACSWRPWHPTWGTGTVPCSVPSPWPGSVSVHPYCKQHVQSHLYMFNHVMTHTQTIPMHRDRAEHRLDHRVLWVQNSVAEFSTKFCSCDVFTKSSQSVYAHTHSCTCTCTCTQALHSCLLETEDSINHEHKHTSTSIFRHTHVYMYVYMYVHCT